MAKRKHGLGPPQSAARGLSRPAKKSKGAATPAAEPAVTRKTRARDVFEAEDSDPDEVKHVNRYDAVDNYEYELPSDFEDEEIDEELAFTAEDQQKYAGFFQNDEDAEDEQGLDANGDDVSDADDYSEPEEDAEEGLHTGRDADGDAAELDAMFGDVGGEGDEGEDDDDEGDDTAEAGHDGEERHRAMLAAALGSTTPHQQRRGAAQTGLRQASVVSEAYPESEFNVHPGSASAGGGAEGELTVDALLRGLGDSRRKLGPARKLLSKMTGAGAAAPVAAPLPRPVRERQERKAGYQATNAEITRWQPIVKANREAPSLKFESARGEVMRVDSTAAMVQRFEPNPDNEMEAQVAALLEAAGAANSHAVQEAEEALSMKALSSEEVRARRERLAKMRSLLFYHEVKAKRMAAIKSKEYHRQLSRAAKRKARKDASLGLAGAGEEGGDSEKAAARRQAEEAEFNRAKERLTLKHRNTSKWAKRALKRGAAVMDEGTKAALAEQLAMGQSLRRKIEGGPRGGGSSSGSSDGGSDSGSGSDGSTSASDEEGTGDGSKQQKAQEKARRVENARTKAAAMEILAGGDGEDDGGDGTAAGPPKKGLFALPFMARALERQRLAARQEASQLLQEFEEQEVAQEAAAAAAAGADVHAAANGGSAADEVLANGANSAKRNVGTAGNTSSGRKKFGKATGASGSAAAVEGGLAKGFESDDEFEDADAKLARLGLLQQEQSRHEQQQQQAQAVNNGNASSAANGSRRGKAVLLDQSSHPAALTVNSSSIDAELAARRASGAHASVSHAVSTAAAAAISKAGMQGVREAVRSQLFTAPHANVNGSAVGGSRQEQQQSFVPTAKFSGERPGYAFKKGPKGVGYYVDAAAVQPAITTNGKKTPAAAGQATTTVAGAAAAAAALSAEATMASQAAAAKRLKTGGSGQSGNASVAMLADGADDESGEDDDRGGVGGGARAGQGMSQRDLVRQAFAGDAVEAEFEGEKAVDVAGELPAADLPTLMPGWGNWGSAGPSRRDLATQKAAAAKVQRERDKAAAGRSDAGLKHVVISEKWDKKAVKYQAPQVPFPFESREVYERSLRQPLGREYNPDVSFRNLTRPAILKSTGVMIEPAKFSKPVAAEAASGSRKAKSARETRAVAVVSGGMNSARKRA